MKEIRGGEIFQGYLTKVTPFLDRRGNKTDPTRAVREPFMADGCKRHGPDHLAPPGQNFKMLEECGLDIRLADGTQ